MWQKNTISLDFDGTAEELKKVLAARDTLPDFGNVDYHDNEFIFETEEPLSSLSEGHPVIEVNSVEEEL